MEYYPLNITIISADGLKNVNLFSKMDVYALVKILGYPKNKKKTNIDKNSGTNPKWNFQMTLNIEEASLNNPAVSLLIQLKATRSFGSDREIGEVNVPILELYNAVAAAGEKQDLSEKFVEYQVRRSSGRPKGTLKFSYKFGEKFFQEKVEEKKKTKVAEPVAAYPAAGASMAYPQQPQMGYAMPPPGYQMPTPPGYGGYPPAGYPNGAPSGYGYQPPPGYGYQPPPGYGYPQPMMQAQPPKKSKAGMGMGLGMGLIGGLLVGDMISDVGEMDAYDAGYEDAMGF